MLISEVIKLLEALNEEQLCYVYTYIKGYFDIDDKKANTTSNTKMSKVTE